MKMEMRLELAQEPGDERVDTWGSTPTMELPLLTQEECNAHMLRLVQGRVAR